MASKKFPIRVRIRKPWSKLPLRKKFLRVAFSAGVVIFLAAGGVLLHYYVLFSGIIDSRFSGDVFNRTGTVYAAPLQITRGQELSAAEVARRLRRSGYAEEVDRSPVGYYRVGEKFIQIHPGKRSLHRDGKAITLYFQDGLIESMVAGQEKLPLYSYLLEPEPITTLFGRSRTKRRLLRYADIPTVVRDAVIATEDRQFFSHIGINFYRILAAAINNLRRPQAIQGASTITMQLARNFFLTPARTYRRKMAEIYIALILEARLTKEEIFELYANQTYLGHRGSFAVHGFGEAARAYFNKEVWDLTVPEAALLAGMIRAPNIYYPYKYPERATERRDTVIRQMVEIEALSQVEAEQAIGTGLEVAARNVEASQAPYFVDMVRKQLLGRFPEEEILSGDFQVYTTLDLGLQRAASEAVQGGTESINERLNALAAKGILERPEDPLQPQVCLVAIDPHTGAVKALVGGRDYGSSQLNHTLAKRQPGSSFKPFVYAAALNSAVDGSNPLITTASTVVDEPTRFEFGEAIYEPENYKQQYHGLVTLRKALALSLNVATVKLAETIGYWKVEELATLAGFNREVEATPAIALGAYVATPLEIIGAYTIFANQGEYRSPFPIAEVRNAEGVSVWQSPRESRQVLDPRISFLMTHLLQTVINRGTGGGVRRRGFELPAAGKTGTSRDGWFVGYTSNLLCAVWVGYDDDRELGLSGASSALPIWTMFMKRAAELPAYKNAGPFRPPPGISYQKFEVPEEVFLSENEPRNVLEVFVEGTEPEVEPDALPVRSALDRLLAEDQTTMSPSEENLPPVPVAAGADEMERWEGEEALPDLEVSKPPSRRGVFRKFLGLFHNKGKKQKRPSDGEIPKASSQEP